MKQLLVVLLVCLILTAGSVVVLASFGEKSTHSYTYGPRGAIYSQTGEELYPPWPATL